MLNQAFGSSNRNQQEWLLLTSACLLRVTSGFILSTPVFANFMRAAFALQQTELDVAMTFQYSGLLLMFPVGLLYDRWGARVTVAVGGVASTLASLAITLAFTFPSALRGHAWGLWLLLFVYGHSLSYAELTGIAVAMSSFGKNRLGRVMAAMGIFFNFGPAISALLHYLVFGNLSRPPDSQNAVGAMAVQTVMGAAAHVFAVVFVHQPILLGTGAQGDSVIFGERSPILYGEDVKGISDHGSIEKEQTVVETQTEVKAQTDTEATLVEQHKESAADFLCATNSGCLSPPIILLVLTFALSAGLTYAVAMNVTTVTRSLALSGHDVKFFWVPIIISLIWRIALGPLIDLILLETYQCATALFACLAVFGTPALLLITLPMGPVVSPLGITLSSYVLLALLDASLFTLGPAILAQTIPQHLYGRLYSTCLLLGCFLSLPLMVQSGILYDRRATVINGTVSCSGQECYIYGNIANSACHLFAMVLLLVLVALMHSRSRV